MSTPIGNLKDITLRALEVLAEVDLIAAEDSRRAQILLNHFQLQTPTTSYYDYNKESKTPFLMEKLHSGQSIALISDAGTPGISDPCFYLIREAIQDDIPISMIPGPTAFVPALLLSGLPLHRFCFEGFLPVKKGRQTRLTQLKDEKRTLIFYESPHRISKTLTDFLNYWGNRRIAVIKEISKIHELVLRGTISEVLAALAQKSTKGEWVIVVAGCAD